MKMDEALNVLDESPRRLWRWSDHWFIPRWLLQHCCLL